jgi:hypothetical protein
MLSRNCRDWFYFPIEMPVTSAGWGPATVGLDADKITYCVWDKLFNEHGSFDNLYDAINEAMRLNHEDQHSPTGKGETMTELSYREAAIGALEQRRDQYREGSQTWLQIHMDILLLRSLPAVQPAPVTVQTVLSNPLKDRGKMIKQLPGAPAGGYPLTPNRAESAEAAPVTVEKAARVLLDNLNCPFKTTSSEMLYGALRVAALNHDKNGGVWSFLEALAGEKPNE